MASALLQEGAELPGSGGATITSINNTAANHAGGYAATTNGDFEGAAISYIWGSGSGGAGGVLAKESVIGTLEQTSFESFFGLGNSGSVGYSATTNDPNAGLTGLDGRVAGSDGAAERGRCAAHASGPVLDL